MTEFYPHWQCKYCERLDHCSRLVLLVEDSFRFRYATPSDRIKPSIVLNELILRDIKKTGKCPDFKKCQNPSYRRGKENGRE